MFNKQYYNLLNNKFNKNYIYINYIYKFNKNLSKIN